jgi:glycosyltransferase involved in cell wall biosynthesis/ubiquinone/menaquinone biosynthesis C-methylase UbiE
MSTYLFVSSDLRSAGPFADDRLAEATDRHKYAVVPPPLAETHDVLAAARSAGVQGLVLQLARGFLIRAQLEFVAKALGSGNRVWLYWPAEQAIEAVDEFRLASYRRLRRALLVYERVLTPLARLRKIWRRMAPAARWVYRGEFPISRMRVQFELERLIARARPAPLAFLADGWKGRIAGCGVYLRTDFWTEIQSGGSYGHTAYVAKELAAVTDRMVCFLPQHYRLLEQWGIDQVVLDRPTEHTTGEDPIVGATEHYIALLKAALLTIKPAYIYERLCIGNYAAARLSHELRIPYVVEYNGSEISMAHSFGGRGMFYEQEYLLAEMAAFKQAALISVISARVRDQLVERGVEEWKILVNPNGADTEVYAPPGEEQRARIREELGFGANDWVVGFTGTFGGWHGIDVLAHGIPRVCAAAPSVKFLLIGDGSHKQLVDAAVVQHALQERVVSTGRVPQAEGARLLQACDVYVSPHSSHMVDSKFFGSPTKLFEYMAMGGGIVASDLEQIGEVLSPALRAVDFGRQNLAVGSERSVLCTPGSVDEFVDAVVGLAERPAIARALGRNARTAAVECYSWKKHVERLWMRAADDERVGRGSRLMLDDVNRVATGDAYKDQVQNQWDNNPVGSQYAQSAKPRTLEWFLEVEAHRYGKYAPWMPETMEFARHAGEDVLEVGGGMGTDLVQFAKNGARVTDVDLSGGHLALAKQNFQLRGLDGRFVHHDAETLPFEDASFDVVYSNGVIHHTPHTDLVVREMYRVLRPGGRAIVMVYAESSLAYWRSLVLWEALRTEALLTRSMGDVLSRTVEMTDNDARPLVKVYTRASVRKLFREFADVTVVQRQMEPSELPRSLRRHLPWIERVAGWNLIVKARRPPTS